jgi:hypothetical protein
MPKQLLKMCSLAVSMLIAACQDSAKPRVTPAEIVGAWVITLSSPPGCTSTGAGQQLFLDVQLSGHSQSPTATVNGGWDFDRRLSPRYSITGTLDYRTGGLTAALWQQKDSVGSTLDAVVQTDGALQGQLVDPRPGFAPNFSGGACTFQVIGQR